MAAPICQTAMFAIRQRPKEWTVLDGVSYPKIQNLRQDAVSAHAQSQHELLSGEGETGQKPANCKHIGEAAFRLWTAAGHNSAPRTRPAKPHHVVRLSHDRLQHVCWIVSRPCPNRPTCASAHAS